MKIVLKPKEYTQYISIFMMLMASAGYYLRTFSQTLCYIVLLLALCLLIVGRQRLCIDGRTLGVSLSVGALGLLSSLFANDPVEYTILPFVALIISALMVSNIEKHEFENVYLHIIVFISAIAIIAEIIFMVAPQVIEMFPVVTNSADTKGYNLLFAVVSFQYGAGYRVQGIFWEPGAFQFFIALALLILWKSSEDGCYKGRIVKYVILITAMIMTFSTTAYIVLLLFALVVMGDVKKNAISVACIGAFIVALVMIMYVPSVQTMLNKVLDNKLTDFFSAFSGESKNQSAQVRYDSVYYPFKLFLNNPIFGAGYDGLLELESVMGHNMTTCTPINYFATYGIIYGVYMIVLFFKLAQYFALKKSDAPLIFILLLTTVISEDFNATVCLNTFLLLGVRHQKSKSIILKKI